MRRLNGICTETSNRLHDRVGHLFQGRFKAILVDASSKRLELAHYVVLNPLRAGMIREPDKWLWSWHRAMVGDEGPPDWLATDGLLATFAKRRADTRKRWIRFVAEGKGVSSTWIHLNRQVFLGDDAFVSNSLRSKLVSDDGSVPKA